MISSPSRLHTTRFFSLRFDPFTFPRVAEKDKDIARNIARFAFCKDDATLIEAGKRLRALRAFAHDQALLPPVEEEASSSSSSAAK